MELYNKSPNRKIVAVIFEDVLTDGRLYGQTGELNFVGNTVAPETDTILLRGTIPNPPLPYAKIKNRALRELFDGEFVRVLVEGVQPVTAIAIPRAAVLSDQEGNYVYVIGPQNKAEIRRVELGQSTPATAFVMNGLQEGERIILEGLQRVHPGEEVAPNPASFTPGSDAGNP